MVHAVPLGIYFTHTASVLRPGVCAKVGEWCCFQLLKRLDAQTYAIYAAASYDDIRLLDEQKADEAVESRVIVTTITRQNLHQRCCLLSQPGVEKPLFVAPASILQGKLSSGGKALQLQLVASSAWLCYFRLLRTNADGSVCIQVAALPHRLESNDSSYTTTLTSQEFALALAVERADLALATCDLREKVEEHAQAISGTAVEHIWPTVPLAEEDQEMPAPPKLAYPPEVLRSMHIEDVSACATHCDRQHTGEGEGMAMKRAEVKELEPVFVPEDIARFAAKRLIEKHAPTTTGKEAVENFRFADGLKQKMWLQAALLALQWYGGQARLQETREAIAKQDHQIRIVLVNWLSNSCRLVEAEPVRSGRRARGYLVRIEQPTAATNGRSNAK